MLQGQTSIYEVQRNLCPPEAYDPMMGSEAGVQTRVSGRLAGALTGSTLEAERAR